MSTPKFANSQILGLRSWRKPEESKLWATTKVKTVNGERQLQALIDKKKMIIIETSIRSDLHLEDAGGTDCLPTATIFKELARMGRKQRKDIEVSQSSASTKPMTEKETNKESVPTHSFDPSQSGEDRMKLHELMDLCTKLSDRVLALESIKTTQALEIASLKRRVKNLEKKASKRTHKFKRLYKVGTTRRVESSNDANLGAQDASKYGRKIADLNADVEVTLGDETQEMDDDNLMFDTSVLEEQEIEFEKVVEEIIVSVVATTKSIPVSAAEVVTIASTNVEITDELTLAQTLIEIQTAKHKPITTAATTVTSVKLRARGIIFHDQEEQVAASTKTFSSSQLQLSQVKYRGKGIMVEPEVPLKKKDQVALNEEMARNLKAQLQAELIEEERLARQKKEEVNIALIESWDNIQVMMEGDFELAPWLPAEEHEEITLE
ncbi:hypothetical protein Tco_0708843 [Tanacetum coccineum]